MLGADGWNWAPAWSPDGSRIAAIYWNHEDHPAIVSYDVSSGDREILFRYPHADGYGYLDWSPDGRHVVFSMRTNWQPFGNLRKRIFILTLETGEVCQLVPDAVGAGASNDYRDFAPVWSRAAR